jgi:hypothetical protein
MGLKVKILGAFFCPRTGKKTGPGKLSAKRYFAASGPGAIKTACPDKQALRL